MATTVVTAACPGPYRTAPGEVHCWSVALDVPAETSAAFHETLTAGERLRSARLHSAGDRQRFIVAHGALRAVLGCHLGVGPREVRFVYGAFGKPELSPAFGRPLKFNLSHSADLALVAVAADAEVGVDVECVRWRSDYPDIARHFFSAAELAQLNGVASEDRAEAFFGCWTKKEAYVKACGEGLGMSLPSFSVPLNTEAGPVPAEIHGALGDSNTNRRWSLYTLQPAPGYVGALAIEGSGWRLTQRAWQMSA